MKKCRFFYYSVLLVSGCFTLTLHAQYAKQTEQLDAYFAQALKDWRIPGMAVAIVKDGEVVLAKGYGMRNNEKGGQVDKHTLFAIASNTKAFNAAALAILVDEGKLSWNDRVQQHLPYFQLYDPYVTQEMRIRDLLCHRSGLGTFSGDLLWYGTKYSAEEVVKRARFLSAAGQFRGSYGYSNIMFLAAGEVVPAVTGKSWRDFVRERILDEIDMNSTVMSTNALAAKRNVASPHKGTNSKWQPLEWYNWDAMVAAGGIISNVSDMAKWITLQLDRGELKGKRIFSEDASRLMWTPHTVIPVSKRSEELHPSTHFIAYGLGWVLMDYQGHKVTMHGGGYDGMFSRVALAPEAKLGMVILTNAMTSIQTALTYKILDTYLDGGDEDWSKIYLERAEAGKKRAAERRTKAEKTRAPDTKPSLPLEAYTGKYGGPMYGDATVKLKNGHLVVQFEPAPDLVGDLSHWHFDTFVIKWRKEFSWFGDGKVQFLMDQNGKVVEMKIDVPNEDFWFTELEFRRKE